jgi:DNA-binding HxlR family transcriptional regulator
MTKKRTYNDLCGLSHALELVGERWAILILRELTYGPKRFTDLRHGLPSASPNVLSQRLRELEEHGVVVKRKLAPPAASQVYELTDWGRDLEPTLQSLGAWAARSPHFPDSGHFSASSMAMNLETMFLADKAEGIEMTIALKLEGEEFALRIADSELVVQCAASEEPDAVIEADPMALIGFLYHGEDLTALEKAGAIKIEGDRKAIKRLPSLFELPQPVELETA